MAEVAEVVVPSAAWVARVAVARVADKQVAEVQEQIVEPVAALAAEVQVGTEALVVAARLRQG